VPAYRMSKRLRRPGRRVAAALGFGSIRLDSEASGQNDRGFCPLAPLRSGVADLTVPKCFPPEDRVALFAVSMAMAANDIEYAIRQAVLANPEGASDEDRERNRFTHKVRLANGFLFEGIDALKGWTQDEPAVAKLLRDLPPEGARLLTKVRGLEQRIGPKTLGHVRQHTFHYPHPDPSKTPDSTGELAEVVANLDDVPVSLHIGSDVEHTFPFADKVALSLALSRHDEPDVQTEKIRDGAVAFVNLVRHIHLRFCKQRGIAFELVE
jgi:hypothetical protein